MSKGAEAEKCAELFLLTQGLQLVDRNYRCKGGEIDLIMQDKNCTVFVEVRLRSNPRFANSLESVTHSKQQKLCLAARHFLQDHPERAQKACRFDVVAFSSLEATPEWVQAAFH